MKDFHNTIHCTSRVHCRMCRNKEGGRNWRMSLSQKTADFGCPHGYSWGDVSDFVGAIKNELPEWVVQREKTCTKCDDNECGLKIYLVNHKCAFNRRIKVFEQICPAGKWDKIK